MTLAAGTKLGPYEILSPIGAGGMGEVYRARDKKLDRFVAVKVLTERLGGDASALARFEREAKAVAALSHPNILAIHDFGSEGSVTYAVMELLEGETLRERLSGGALPVSKATDIASQIAEGLAAAHEKGITHRDLKPGNVFLTKAGRVKILDFGLAKLKAQEPAEGEPLSEIPTMEAHTSAGAVMGTVGYMAPEQARGHPADARSDIFAFGVVLYEMLAGRRAFQGDTASDTLAAILMKDPDPLPPVTPPGLDRVVRRCLEKRPEDRYASAREVLLALEVASTSSVSPVSVPAAMVPESRGWSRREWALLGGVTVLLLALAATGLWWWKGKSPKPAAVPQTRTIQAIAVFPLDDLSGDPSQAYFAPGMTDALNTKLTQIKSLKVMGKASVERCVKEKMPLPKVAEALGVDAVVQGSVLRVGDTVRISVTLLDARTDANLWAESYERKMADVLVLQGEVAQAIAASVRAAVTPGEKARLAGRPVDPRAYDEYLSGVYDFWNLSGNEAALVAFAHFKKAIELDPGFALPYAYLCVGYRYQYVNSFVPYEVAHPLAKAAGLKAVELDPSSALAHAALAQVLWVMEGDLQGAAREMRKAVELDDKDPGVLGGYGLLLIREGRVEEGIELARKAADLDPINPNSWQVLAIAYRIAHRWDEAVRCFEKSFELGSTEAILFRSQVGVIYLFKKGDEEKALACAEKVRTLPGWEKEFMAVANLALIYARTGRRAESLEMLKVCKPLRVGKMSEEIDLALVYAWLGDRARAFEHLEKACSLPGKVSAADAAEYESLFPEDFRKDSRCQALMKSLGSTGKETP